MEQAFTKKRSTRRRGKQPKPTRAMQSLLLEARSHLLGISTGCPISSDSRNCILSKLTSLPLRERVAFVEDLNPQEISQILTCYRVCSLHASISPQRDSIARDERL